MQGLMQDRPLLVSSLIDYAQRYHADVEITTSVIKQGIHRSDYGSVINRAAQLAHTLAALGVKGGAVSEPWLGITTGIWSSIMRCRVWALYSIRSILACFRSRSAILLITLRISICLSILTFYP